MAKTNRSAQGKAAASAAAAPTGIDKTDDATAAAAQAKADEEAAAAAAKAKADEEAAAAAAAAAQAKADEEAAATADEGFDFTGKAIQVTSTSGKQRWRAGRVFAREPVKFEADELTAEELGAILADPQLRVSVA